MSLERGQKLSHYRLVEKIGEGGMGVVWKARDEKLRRDIALKVLPSELVQDSERRRRLFREARSAAAINHPNIGTVHEVDDVEGTVFIAMELVDGKTLRSLLGRNPLAMPDALRIAMEMAEGLAAAHLAKVIHRDLKPDNVLVRADGHIKILDFGLAKVHEEARPSDSSISTAETVTDQMTREGRIQGTFAYMAPEQARGGAIDARSDIFSFGTTLYEMVTGRTPFQRGTSLDTLSAILNEPALPPSQLNADVPPELERILAKCLEKEPTDRYQDTEDLAVDLRQLRRTSGTAAPVFKAAGSRFRRRGLALVGALAALTVVFGYLQFGPGRDARESSSGPTTKTARSERKMIVVLPFENLGPAEDDYFADGITDAITARLASIYELGVISRTSAIKYKATDKTVKQIGEELGVGYLLGGTIQWQRSSEGPSRVRVTPQLIRVRDDTHLWAESYDRMIDDIFQVQSDIAGKVIEQLGVTLLESERQAVEARPTEVFEAYDFYLRGMQYFERSLREQDFRIAIQMYEKAVELDPSFALAYAKLSETHSELYWFHFDRSEERLAKAKEAVEKAFRLEPDLPEAHQAQAWYYYWGHLDYEDALEQFGIALKSQPNNADLFSGIGAVRRRQGQFEQAVANYEKAVEFDPRSAGILHNTAQTYYLLRDYAAAERYWNRAISLSPNRALAWGRKARLYLGWEGDTEKARRVLEEASETIGPTDEVFVGLTWIQVDVFDGEYQGALNRLSSGSADALESQFFFIPKALFSAQIHGWMNRPQLARAGYDTARALLEGKLQDQPEDARLHSSLGIAYAGLGRAEEAIGEGKMGVELLPVSKDAWKGVYRVEDLARIYVMVGEDDAAIDQLEFLLARPGVLSIPLLRLDPTWDSLRDQPGFQELVERSGTSSPG
jgi:TolB-like protein/tRNA A-37 threonylcarbamoyl transferase component Bud32/cytochrome c-type biogenesis protein CcmH/NrfG